MLLALGLARAQPVEIPFWHVTDPPGGELLETLAREFNQQQTAYRILPRYVGQYREGGLKLLAALYSGSTPALFQAELSFLGRLQSEGLALPLDEYLGTLPPDFYPGLLEAGRVKGKTIGLPFNLTQPVLFYNADQFAAKGLAPPRTWAEFEENAARLTTRAAKGFLASADAWSFSAVLSSRGGSLVDAKGHPTFTDPKVVESLEMLYRMVRRGSAQSRGVAEFTFAVTDFLRTKASMVIGPLQLLPIVEKRTPVPFRLGIAPLPLEPGGRVPLAGGTLAVLRGATPQQAQGAVAFWKFLTQPQNLARWVQTTYDLPLRRSALGLLESFYREDPRRQLDPGKASLSGPWIQDPGFAYWYDYLEEALEKSLKGGVPPRKALEEAQRKALSR
ncbi:MAG TPA: ABC transporter substrate-binding protein [Meiothermus sp.]|nr:ABC transporter substrate-binding protein [Meiothermus sp.]